MSRPSPIGPWTKAKCRTGIEARAIRVAGQFADRRLDRKYRDPFDQFLARLPIGDEVGDGNVLEFMPVGEGLDLPPDHDRAVVIGEFADHRDRRQAGKPAQVDGGLGVARAHQHAAVLGDQGEHMARPHEVARAHVAVGERAHGVGALLGGNAGGQAVPHVDRDGEGGAERRIVHRHHRGKVQVGARRRRSEGAQTMPQQLRMMKAIFSVVHKRGGDDEVALILAIVVVGDGDDLAARESLDGGGDGVMHILPLVRLRRVGQKVVERKSAGRLGDDTLGRRT